MFNKVEKNYNGYDFYYQCALGDRKALYNIVPHDDPVPSFGYYKLEAIENIMGVKFPDRYQKNFNFYDN